MRSRIVCFSHLCNQTYITGAEKLILFLMRELRSNFDFECILIVPQEGILSQEAADAGIPYYVQPCRLFYSMMEPHAALHDELEQIRTHSEWDAVVDLLRRLEPDYVLINTCVHAIPAVAARSLNIPVIWQITEKIPDNAYTSHAAAIVHQYAEAVIGISQSALAFLTRYPQAFPSSPPPVLFTLPPSWDDNALEPSLWTQSRAKKRSELGIPPDTCLVGYVAATITSQKGLEHFVWMAMQLAERNTSTRFIVIGCPAHQDYFERCQQLVQRSSLKDKFYFVGFENKIQHVYPAIDIVVTPSLFPEGFGMTAFEGLIFGKPVVVYRSGGLEEIHQFTGNERYIADVGNWRELSSIVNGLISSQEQRTAAGIHNYNAVRQVYGIEHYRSLLAAFWNLFREQKRRNIAVQTDSTDSQHELAIDPNVFNVLNVLNVPSEVIRPARSRPQKPSHKRRRSRRGRRPPKASRKSQSTRIRSKAFRAFRQHKPLPSVQRKRKKRRKNVRRMRKVLRTASRR
ncbi:glycosyltransferase family 4 protein [Paenibacillus agilis]|uniref:Glycosyltransferase family 4 protein n=1 Tax=Paenibacillus agilis TaxID=3020863 RepID=A0A559IHP3_9BACL|nr:glycosyltransferase family 4 protein [Paenibacillus agilis]TVX87186.1 glycosyltransferase family 4 protein [Paenibacillus agilis]